MYDQICSTVFLVFHMDLDTVSRAMLQAGFAGEDGPSSVFPSVIGWPKYTTRIHGADDKTFFVGEEAQAKRGVLAIKYPIEHGMCMNYVRNYERLW